MADQSTDQSAKAAKSSFGARYKKVTGESLAQTLDIKSWDPAERIAERFHQLQIEIDQAFAAELETARAIREKIFPKLAEAEGAPATAGVHSVTLDQLRNIQRDVLFAGRVQAVDGVSTVYETLPLTVVQTGVAMANYDGGNGTWGHRIFQKDLRMPGQDAVQTALDILEQRHIADNDDDNGVSDMFRRALMMHAELAVLATQATSPWRMGDGSPLPKELLTGSGVPEIIELSLPLLKQLLLQHRHFIYLPRDARKQRLLQTVGNALRPLEYAIVQDMSAYLSGVVGEGHYGTGAFKTAKEALDEFVLNAGPQVVAGVYRVSPFSRAQVFYAHTDFAAQAAIVAMADSVLVEAKGSPMLLDVAGNLCRELFPPDGLLRPAEAAYARLRQADADSVFA